MALRNYNINENAVVAAAAGSVTAGYAACLDATYTGYVTATTANRALLSGGRLSGVFIGTAVEGDTVPIVGSGHVEADVLGALGGSGDYVNVQSNGSLVRSSTLSSDTIGFYMADGSIEVNTSLQFGGAVTGNATAIQGVSVSSASAGYSQILAGNGTTLRARLGTYDFRDFGGIINSTVAADMTANVAAWNLMKSVVGAGSEVRFSGGSFTFNGPIFWWDGVDFGGPCDIALTFDGAGGTLGSIANRPRFVFAFSDLYGAAASITTLSNGGTGTGRSHYMMTLTGCTGVTTALASELVGRPCRTWNTTNNAGNSLTGIVCAVPANGTLVVWNPRAAATAPDYGLGGILGDGKVGWHVERVGLDLRMRELVLDRGVFLTSNGHYLGAHVNYTESPSPNSVGSTARTITSGRFTQCAFLSSANSQKVRYGLRIAEDIVPYANSSASRYVANGDGIPVPYSPLQVDVTDYESCLFLGAPGSKMSGAAGFGRAGQAEKHIFRGCTFQGVRNGYYVPGDTTGGGGNLCHADFYDCDLGGVYDTAFSVTTSAFGTTVSRCKGETLGGRLVQDFGGVAPRMLNVERCEIQSYPWNGVVNNNAHPSHQLLATNREGPVNVIGNTFNLGSDTSKLRILELNHSQGTTNGRCSVVNFGQNHIIGTTSSVRHRARLTNGNRGPFKFLGTEKCNCNLNGVVTVVTFSQANFNAALAQVGADAADLNEVRAYEVARLFEYTLGVANLRAHGAEDDSVITLWSQDEAAGTIQITAYAGPEPDANTQLGFNVAGIGTTTVAFAVTNDTLGLIEGSATSSSDEVFLNFGMCGLNNQTSFSTSAHINLPAFVRGYSSTGGNTTGQAVIADAATFVDITFPTNAPEVIAYFVTSLEQTINAGAPVMGTLYASAITLTGFRINTTAAPTAGNSILVTWSIGR